ncbi:MAG TPA: AMP-binding protein, partial [Thermoanaerobaculia bacterium]|nr:AMP-binding protein [Thermoanaerobaculia bacterium]
MIYTSGSTGRPKAVAIEHRSAVALVEWSRRQFSDAELGGMLAATSISFDLSVFELFVTLGRGGKVLLAKDALALPSLPAAWEVRLVNTVPSAMGVLVEGGQVPGSVATVCLAGEPLTRVLADGVYSLPQVARLWNLYGPSEDTTYSTEHLVARRSSSEPTIGRPIAGSRAYVLDRRGSLVPVGVAGELLLAGAGLARGYLGRPGLSAEKFVPDPFSAEPGARLYRTGDLVRWRADGDLQFLGRIDHQVKIRGFRVELGEIEAVLVAEPGVRETVVVVLGKEGERRLVAYVSGDAPSGPPSWDELLKEQVGRHLPAYMVPSAVVVLPALPRTPNGKVNRKALPEPDWGGANLYVAPRTPAEEVVADLFADLLKLPQVSVEDSFFRLGGHSLLASQLINRLQKLYAVALPLRKIFEAPTVAQLAAHLTEIGPGGEVLALEKGRDRRALRLSFAQERLWFLERLDPGQATYNMPAAVRLSGRLSLGALARAVAEILRRHEVLRSRIFLSGGQALQQVRELERLPLACIDLRALPGDHSARLAWELAQIEARAAFDLAEGPFLRVRLIRLGEDEHLGIFCFHHIASDGWSIAVFFDELKALYEAFEAAEPSPLPELPIQYADFAAWQRRQLQSSAGQMSFWREYLAGAPELLELPLDRPRPAQRSGRGRELPFYVPGSVASRLETVVKRQDATMFMALFAAFGAVLARLSHQHDLVLGVPTAGRSLAETEGLIGFFVNSVPVRLRLGANPSFESTVEAVKQSFLAAFAHQEVPFEMMVAELKLERHLSHTPIFQVLLVHQNRNLGSLKMGSLGLKKEDLHSGTTKFDLSLSVSGDAEGLDGALEYDSDLFERATIVRLTGYLSSVLERVAAQPGTLLSDLPLLSEAERWQLLAEWQLPADLEGIETTLGALLLEQAAHRREAVALVVGEQRLSYGELLERARALAALLQSLGVGPEERVGVCLERHAGLVVALAAVLLAGGAYVPLDPAYPVERLGWMLEDSKAAYVISGGKAREVLAGLEGFEVLALSAEGELEEERLPRLPPLETCPALPQNLAYLIYTSGSTGRPKAVAIAHRSAVALLEWSRSCFSDHELGGMLGATSVSFDLSVFELFVTLGRGGKVILAQDAVALPALPAAWEVRLVNTVPSAMGVLVEGGK